MILQALYDVYQRLADDPDVEIAPPGFQYVDFDYAVQLRKDERFAGFVSLADEEGNLRRFLVPEAVKRSSGVAPNLLWDKPDYVFMLPKSDETKDVERAQKKCEAFRDRIIQVFGSEPDDEAIKAVLEFLVPEPPAENITSDPLWAAIVEKGRNLCFIYGDDTLPVTQRRNVLSVLREYQAIPGKYRRNQSVPRNGTPSRSCYIASVNQKCLGCTIIGCERRILRQVRLPFIRACTGGQCAGFQRGDICVHDRS